MRAGKHFDEVSKIDAMIHILEQAWHGYCLYYLRHGATVQDKRVSRGEIGAGELESQNFRFSEDSHFEPSGPVVEVTPRNCTGLASL